MADFHSVQFYEQTENLLFTRSNVAVHLIRNSVTTNVLLCKIPSAREILLSDNQP